MRRFLFLTAALLAAPAALAGPVSFSSAPAPKDGAIALTMGKDGLTGAAKAVDDAAGGAISRAAAAADFKGKADKTITLFGVGPYAQVIVAGVGDGVKTEADLTRLGGRIAQAAKTGTVAVIAPDAPDVQADAAHIALGAELGGYKFEKLTGKKKSEPGASLVFHSADADAARARFEKDGRAVADGVSFARDLMSTPSNIKDPQFFVDRTRAAFKSVAGVTIEVLDEKQMAKLGMGAILGVGQGSTRPPRMLVVRYRGAGDAAPIAFVGKGITFDSGGISIKPADGMWRMRYDMGGAAAAIGAVLTAAKRGAKANVIGVAALAENMPDGGAIRPGDVLTSMSGKTIEVLNTDAEGRLVLADGLWYVQEKDKPQSVITIATLTGAVRTALGDDYAGLFANNEALAKKIEAAAAATDEPVWRLPIHDSIRKDIESDVADVKNVVEGGAGAGASIGAAFIEEWAKEGQAWGHLDIASVGWATETKATTPKGAAGFGVRLFDALVRDVETK
jgi:leucyl aminopeptidase